MNITRDRLRLETFKDFQGFFRGITNDRSVVAFGYVSLKFLVICRIECLVEIVVQIPQELLTGKQTRHPPSF